MKYTNRAIKFIKKGNKKKDYFKNFEILADTNLHQQTYDLIEELTKFKNKENFRVLDIACGNGAFSLRLSDHGFIHIDSCDINDIDENLKKQVNFHKIDINTQDFIQFCHAHENTYDLIVSLETIEHIENPWHFIRCIKRMLKPDGYFIVSTPNIESPWSKIHFIFQNTFFQFSKDDLSYGHINPMTEFEILTVAENYNLKCQHIVGAGEYPIVWLPEKILGITFFKMKWSLYHLLIYPFMRKKNFSWCKIYVFKNS
jgi:2-polyprenyl-3-methyl-5-hydroxy-6-metoxy-1,4-benzoquinol methylase